MSGSEIMSGRDSTFGIGLHHQKNSSSPPPAVGMSNNMRLAYSSDGTAVYKPINSPAFNGGGDGGGVIQHGINMNMSEPSLKRKRGRPRKYGPDGTMSLGLSSQSQSSPSPPTPPPPPPPVVVLQTQPIVFSPSMTAGTTTAGTTTAGTGTPTSPNSNKKARGRPPGSGNKKPQQQQIEPHGSSGVGFTPHVITVKAGEDVSSKIMSFSQHGPRAVCILSANGAISNVTLRQAATSGGTVTYEGRFEILSLSGSFLLSETGGQRSRTGGLSVSLAGPDGRVLGGGVAGLLTAASPVQVVVGSFLADMPKPSKSMKHEPSSAPSKYAHGGAGNGSPPSRGTLSESSGGPGSPLNQSTGACNNNTSGMPMSWK